jgi:hypothetical protein
MCYISATNRSLRQVQICYLTGSAWRCVCSGYKVRDRHGKPLPPNSTLCMLYLAVWDDFCWFCFSYIISRTIPPPHSSSCGCGRCRIGRYLRYDFDSMAIRWRYVRHDTGFAHWRLSTQIVCTASTWRCHELYEKQYLSADDSVHTLLNQLKYIQQKIIVPGPPNLFLMFSHTRSILSVRNFQPTKCTIVC